MRCHVVDGLVFRHSTFVQLTAKCLLSNRCGQRTLKWAAHAEPPQITFGNLLRRRRLDRQHRGSKIGYAE
jgi:hypothetical protein